MMALIKRIKLKFSRIKLSKIVLLIPIKRLSLMVKRLVNDDSSFYRIPSETLGNTNRGLEHPNNLPHDQIQIRHLDCIR